MGEVVVQEKIHGRWHRSLMIEFVLRPASESDEVKRAFGGNYQIVSGQYGSTCFDRRTRDRGGFWERKEIEVFLDVGEGGDVRVRESDAGRTRGGVLMVQARVAGVLMLSNGICCCCTNPSLPADRFKRASSRSIALCQSRP